MELLEPVSELGIVKPSLYEKLLGGQAIQSTINENVVLSEN